MSSPAVITAVLLVLLGGLFGWTLGKLPDRYVYVVAAGTIIVAVVVISGLR